MGKLLIMKAQTKLLKRAVDMYGSQSALARAIGVSAQSISSVLLADKGDVSPRIANAIHKLTNGEIPRDRLNRQFSSAVPAIEPSKKKESRIVYAKVKEDRSWPYDRKILIRAIKQCGSVAALSKKLKVSVPRIYQMLNSAACKLSGDQKVAIKKILQK